MATAGAIDGMGFDLAAFERPRVLAQAEGYLARVPVTITESSSPRSAGGRHDYFSEGEYWWPNPDDPDGPYIRRDGLSNPDNFLGHRNALRSLSLQVPALAAAWLLTRERRYADHAARHLRAWFVDPETRMSPHLRYSQAVKGRSTGRSFGVIDGLYLVEVARAASHLIESGALPSSDQAAVRQWFADYLRWLTSHEYGRRERQARNNHGTSWLAQASELARFTGNGRVLRACRKRYRKVIVPDQIAADGSFPHELARTKPYAYSLFNLDVLAIVCQTLSTPKNDLWRFELRDGRGIGRALEFIVPYIRAKDSWPYPPDVMFWENWPIRHASLLLGGLALGRTEYIELWQQLDPAPTVDEVIRNYPLRQPLLWVATPSNTVLLGENR
jgi:hypothetical protein